MSIYGYDIPLNPMFEAEQQVSLPPPLGMELSAQFKESWIKAPLSSLLRLIELGAAKEGSYYLGPEGEMIPFSEEAEAKRRAGPQLNYEQWEQSQYNIKGLDGKPALKFEDMKNSEGVVYEEVAKIITERKQAELKRQEVLSRSPSGIGRGVLGLGASFLAQALDPLNLTASFIPVVKGGFLASKLGVVGSRISKGAIEGAVGNVVVEPLVFAAAKEEQSDYTLNNALLNVLFGAGIGAGGHVIFGKLGDVLKIRSQADHLERIKATIRAIDEGEPVNLEPLLKASDIESKVNTGRVELKNYVTKNELRMSPEEIKARQEFDATTKKYHLYDESGYVELDPEIRKDLKIAKMIADGEASVLQRADLEKTIPLEHVYDRQVDEFGIVKDIDGKEIFDPMERMGFIDKNILPEVHKRETDEWTANQVKGSKEELIQQAERELIELRNKTLEDVTRKQNDEMANLYSEIDRLTFTEDVRKNIDIMDSERARLRDAIKHDTTPVGRQLVKDLDDIEAKIKQVQTETKYRVDLLTDCLIGGM